MIGRVLDSSALLAWGRRTSPFVDAMVWSRAQHSGYVVPLVTTAPALAAALAQLNEPAVPVLDALLSMEISIVDELTPSCAPGVAVILRAAGPYAAEQVTAASIVRTAKRRGLPVVTANPFPLRALASDVEIDLIP
ncbi:hypothetical protein Aph01nite_40260 [Acrocarpospora phusangensis]|uniref:PIN domain-containing protein n=1 Tax=Acrocarpospora phusangensis TaxID=1070424 RepID=A0A919QD23_9ACTN|nr:hypothetical protein [Acrocarpospora phusangensis]GIH25716.1 hypothetical protein Aph01nite_40260 [Acrocarpospora phusangensis]